MRVGFIGLGNMGRPMAAHLAHAGHEVTGYDIAGAHTEGVVRAKAALETVQAAEIVVTMLPDGAALRAVAAEIAPAMAAGSVHLDCSTVDVASARAAAEIARSAGYTALDAPVSGGIAGAEAGTLTFMVGGPEETLARARPLLDIMGARIIHCGAAGAGQAAKICNNMILGATMIATCEAFVLADALKLDRQALFDVASTSSGRSWSLDTYCPAPGIGPETPADRDYAPGFAAQLMLKDLRLAQDAAETTGAKTPIGRAARDLYAAMVEEGGAGGRDFSAMLPWLKAGPDRNGSA